MQSQMKQKRPFSIVSNGVGLPGAKKKRVFSDRKGQLPLLSDCSAMLIKIVVHAKGPWDKTHWGLVCKSQHWKLGLEDCPFLFSEKFPGHIS